MDLPPEPNQLVEHFFRHEAGRMASMLTCWLGFGRLDVAEDIVQDTLMQALHVWPKQGIPDNPRAWLYRVAKNRAIDVLRQEKQSHRLSSDALAETPETDPTAMERLFFDDELTDSQLRMLFACCHPALTPEAQLALCLNILCGLNVREIARAFMSSPDTIEKRLYRAKERVRHGDITLVVPTGPQLKNRLDSVLRAVYLLFNEGYVSSQPDITIRQDLCAEALRLARLLTDHPATNTPSADALLALFCFQTARFQARHNAWGDLVLLPDQDRSRWDQELIAKGNYYLNRAATGHILSDYHLEAAIAACHSTALTYAQTDWAQILNLYDLLVARKPTPTVGLNRAVALAQVQGPSVALADVTNLVGLDHSQYYHTVLGDLYRQAHQPGLARQHYERAYQLTPSVAEKKLLDRKMDQV